MCFLEMDPKYPPAIKGGNGKSFSWENHPSISIKVVSYHILSIATFEYPRVSVIGISLLGIAWLEWLNSNPGTLREIIPQPPNLFGNSTPFLPQGVPVEFSCPMLF